MSFFYVSSNMESVGIPQVECSIESNTTPPVDASSQSAVCKMAKGGEPLEFTRLATGHVFVIRGSIPNWVAAPATGMSHDWWLVAAGSLILAGNVSACGWVPGGWQYTVRNH